MNNSKMNELLIKITKVDGISYIVNIWKPVKTKFEYLYYLNSIFNSESIIKERHFNIILKGTLIINYPGNLFERIDINKNIC